MASDTRILHVASLTGNQPFCAGVLHLQDGRVTVTLNSDGLPPEVADGNHWRIGGVGGGQEPGETMAECALREALEELSLAPGQVELVSAERTFFHDMDTDELWQVECVDAVKPMLLQRMTNPTPDTPYKPGLPTGPYIYFGLYQARVEASQIKPGDDVEGLLQVPVEKWELLRATPALGEMLAAGAVLVENDTLPREKRLYVREDESFHTLLSLLSESKS